MNLKDKVNSLPLPIIDSIAYRLNLTKTMAGLTEQERQRERELIASWVADMCQGLDANTIAEAIRNGGNDAMDNFKVK